VSGVRRLDRDGRVQALGRPPDRRLLSAKHCGITRDLTTAFRVDAVSYKSVTVDSTDNDPDFTDTDHIADADNYWRRDLGVVQKDAIRGC
jgi:hypothetical protein